jgi:inner membrane protein
MKSLKLLLRFLTVGGLVLLLLIPLALIRGAIHERDAYRGQAVERVARSTAGQQRLIGPLRVVPWVDTQQVEYTDDKGVVRTRIEKSSGNLLQTPRTLEIQGAIAPDTRKVGLFNVRVYTLQATLKAKFDPALPKPAANVVRQYGKPYLLLGISDVRGLVGTPTLRIDGQAANFVPGTRGLNDRFSGVSADLPPVDDFAVAGNHIETKFDLSGTETIDIVPVADGNHIALNSPWPHPSFSGDFLPTNRHVDEAGKGFTANWEISSLASQAKSQIARDRDIGPENIESLSVGLIDPIDVYTLADRASKYGILFVVLTFVGFGLLELIKRLPIHPLQYLLVGLALAIFFLLLLSLSEHIAFWQAYLVSAAACIGVQFVYLSGVLKSWLRASGFAVMLTALYGALYLLLLSEDYALLLGSLLLFGILAAIMWITRKVDWYDRTASLR